MKEALVIFATAPLPGQVNRPLIGHLTAEEAAELYLCFLRDTFEVLQAVQDERENLSLVLCYTPAEEIEAFEKADLEGCLMLAQHGEFFGERLYNAYLDLFEFGFESVIILQPHTPALTEEILIEALGRLEGKINCVLGPTTQDNFYLIGLKQQPNFLESFKEAEELKAVDLIKRAQPVEISRLPELDEIKLPADLNKLEAEIEAGEISPHFTTRYLRRRKERELLR